MCNYAERSSQGGALRRAGGLALLLAALWSASAWACQRQGNVRPVPPGLDQARQAGAVTLYFSDADIRRAPHADDRDGDGQADKIQDMALQLQAAATLYNHFFQTSGVAAFPRYRDVVAIQAFVLAKQKYNGEAFSEPYFDPGARGCVLRFHVSAALQPRNLTPAHELFHLYHYAHTPIQRAWLREGTARWAEAAFRKGVGAAQPLPATSEALLAVTRESYRAGLMWNRLAALLDPAGRFEIPAAAARLRYVDGTPVIPDDRLHGVAFMRDLFRALRAESERIGRERGRSPSEWTRAQRHDAALDAVIWSVVQRVAGEHAARAPASEELRRFLQLKLQPAPAEKR